MMDNRKLYRATGNGNDDLEAALAFGELVEVVPCEHGNVYPHDVIVYNEYMGLSERRCVGSDGW